MPLCLHTQFCQLSCLGALLTHHVLPGQLLISLLLGVHGRAVKLRSPLPHPAQSHAPRRDKAYGAVCPDQDIPSSDAVLGWDALCTGLSLASLSYGDLCSTAQDPKVLCQCRAEELVLPQTFWQGPAISICIMETVAQPPSTHSEIFLGLAVLMRER